MHSADSLSGVRTGFRQGSRASVQWRKLERGRPAGVVVGGCKGVEREVAGARKFKCTNEISF